MVWLAGEAAFVAGGTSGVGLGIARALVAAGARVAIADLDRRRLREVAGELNTAGGIVAPVPLDVDDGESWKSAAETADALLGPVSILCDVSGSDVEDRPFRVCRWDHGNGFAGQSLAASTFRPRFVAQGTLPHVLTTRSVSGLVAMGLLVPGALSSRVEYTAGVVEARLFGPDRDHRIAESPSAFLGEGAHPDQVGRQIVDALPSRRYVVATRREWGEVRRQDGVRAASRHLALA